MNLRLFAILLIFLSAAPAIAESSVKWQDIQRNLDDGNIVKAKALIQERIKDDPHDARTQLFYATLLLKEKNTTEALNILEQNREQLRTLPEYYNNQAYALFYKGDKEKAIETLKQGIAQNAKFDILYKNISAIYSFMASNAYAIAIDQGAKSEPVLPQLSLLIPKESDADVTVATASKPITIEPSPGATPAQWREEVKQAVEDWAQAWTKQDVNAYLNHYSDDFRTPKGYSLASWRNLRRERVSAPKYIKINLSDFDIRLAGDGSLATAYFLQDYKSNTVNDKVDKLLVLKHSNQQWKIISEDVDN